MENKTSTEKAWSLINAQLKKRLSPTEATLREYGLKDSEGDFTDFALKLLLEDLLEKNVDMFLALIKAEDLKNRHSDSK